MIRIQFSLRFCVLFLPMLAMPLLAMPLLAMPLQAQPNRDREIVPVFQPDVDGYPAIRIPSLVATTRGTLLAFAEGRQGGDHSLNEMILKRSADNGATWGGLQVVHRVDGMALNNPQAVVLDSGRILLMYQQNRLGERGAKPGIGPDSYANLLQFSDDDGVTWSEPRDITESTKRLETVTSVASGPGIGIVLSRNEKYSGRILMPMNQGPFGAWSVYSVISDDGGATWRMGEAAPEGDAPGFANEVQMVELSDGSVLLNARNQGSDKRYRKSSISHDGGETWSATTAVPELVDPVCQASILRFSWPDEASGKPGMILFLNPATAAGRNSGGLRSSRDDGQSWSDPEILYSGGFAYSCMTRMADGRLGVLFERDGYQSISFMAVDVEPENGEQDDQLPAILRYRAASGE